MSSPQQQADGEGREQFSAPSAAVSDAETAQLLLTDTTDKAALNPCLMDAESNASTSASVDSTNATPAMDSSAAHFSDFSFPTYQDNLPEDDHDMMALSEDMTVGLFGTRPPSPSPTDKMDASGLTDVDAVSPSTDPSKASTVDGDNPPKQVENTTTPSTNSPVLGKPSTQPPRSGACLHVPVSETGSLESSSEQVAVSTSLLEEPVSDEFGLVVHGPIDVNHASSSAATSRQPTLAKEDKLGEVVPPWSELKTKAGKERKRLPLACIACRRKKIRCSGEKPACKHCLRSRTPCVYKVTTRNAAPRTDYMAMLDKRLKRMEDRIIKIVPRSEQDAVASLSSVVRAIVKPAIPGSLATGHGATSGTSVSSQKAPSARKRQADEAFGVELDHWARATGKGRLADVSRPHNLLMQQESEENKLLQEGAAALPSRDLQEHLAEVYFENIYGQAYHLLHKPSYMRKLRAGTLPPVLTLSVCAISARFSSHPKLANGANFLRGEEWASHAREIVMRRYEWPNITILTCLLLLGLHEFGTCHGGRSWALGGQAIRMAFALQLHKDVEQDPLTLTSDAPLSFIDREIRRRTMWACFLMDRFNSSGTDRPTFIREETLNIPLPIKEKYFQLDMPGLTENLVGQPVMPPAGAFDTDLFDDTRALDARGNMGVAAYMIRSLAIWGRVINYLNQGGKELDANPMWSSDSEYNKLVAQADEMLASLPESLAFSSQNLHLHDTEGLANQFLFMHIAIQQNILFLNRFAVSSPNNSNSNSSSSSSSSNNNSNNINGSSTSGPQQEIPKAFVTKAGAKAFAAANRISDLLKETESHLVAAPFAGYCAFLSSTVHIFGIFSRNPTMEAVSKRNLATNVKFLSRMKRYWGMFHFMAENLSEQYRACADAARQGTPANENTAVNSPIFQYGDWFDRYPHGVSNADFDPVSFTKKEEKGDDGVLEQKPELHTVEEFITAVGGQQGDASSHRGRGGPANNSNSNAVKEQASSVTSRNGQAKRRSFAKRQGSISSRTTDHQSSTTEMNGAMDVFQQQQQQQRQQLQAQGLNQRRQHRASINGIPTNYNPISVPQTEAQASAAVAAAAAQFQAAVLSPISPIGLGSTSFTHNRRLSQHHQQQQQQQQQQLAQLYSADLLPLSLGQPSGSIMPQLDRQLVFGAYGNMDPMSITALEGHAALGALDWDDSGPGSGISHASVQSVVAAAAAGTLPPHSTMASTDHLPAAVFGPSQEASSAWFMPFNMDPPEIGQDFSGVSSVDNFASIFGSSAMSAHGNGSNGLHHH